MNVAAASMGRAIYATNRAWSDKFIPHMQAIAGRVNFGVAPDLEDMHHNTDLIVLRGRGDVRVACRVRRFKYYLDYPRDFTIRAARDTGARTELDKILAGWGDQLIYAFANKEETRIQDWRVIDLDLFRREFPQLRPARRANPDGTEFLAFNVDDPAVAKLVIMERPK